MEPEAEEPEPVELEPEEPEPVDPEPEEPEPMEPGKACRVSEALELLYSTLLGPKPQNHRENLGIWPLGLEHAGSGAARARTCWLRSRQSIE